MLLVVAPVIFLRLVLYLLDEVFSLLLLLGTASNNCEELVPFWISSRVLLERNAFLVVYVIMMCLVEVQLLLFFNVEWLREEHGWYANKSYK